MTIMAYDGDDAGKLVGRAILADDEKALSEASARITHGHQIVEQWVQSHGGGVISGGGDEGTFQVPSEAVADIETLRKDYEFATQLTMTVGVGKSLSEAGKALMVGKFRGKNQVVHYDPSIEQELSAAQEHVAAGTNTAEEKKITDAYLTKEDSGDHMADCKYCQEAEGHSDDDCEYCAAHDAAKESETDCQYCQEAEAKAGEHEHTGDDCQYCQEAEAAAQEGGVTHDHTGDDCQYCQEANAKQGESNEEIPQEGQESVLSPEVGQETQPNQEMAPEAGQEGQESVEEIARQIETDDPSTQEEAEVVNNLDAADIAVGTSQAADNKDISDGDGNGEGMGEQSPDLGEVLKDGLDSHANNIQKEKVVNLVSHALEGFKAHKDVLEQAKEQAPQLYQSTISMLKAMIEMAKMLGLGQSGGGDSAGPIAAQGEQVVGEDQGEREQNEWRNPFPQHPDHDAAAQEDAALAPKAQGQ
jgi:hypothetical protein